MSVPCISPYTVDSSGLGISPSHLGNGCSSGCSRSHQVPLLAPGKTPTHISDGFEIFRGAPEAQEALKFEGRFSELWKNPKRQEAKLGGKKLADPPDVHRCPRTLCVFEPSERSTSRLPPPRLHHRRTHTPSTPASGTKDRRTDDRADCLFSLRRRTPNSRWPLQEAFGHRDFESDCRLAPG